MAEGSEGPRIAGVADLEAFASAAAEQRQMTEPLRGLVAEMALTGIIRYDWLLVRPVLEHLLVAQLRAFDESSSVEVGPARPALQDGEALEPLIARLRSYLIEFEGAPWTAQRLAELLLEPGKQYKQLHKLALALEKLLLVSSSVHATAAAPPPPLLADLRPVNENPPRVGGGGDQAAKRAREDGDTGMGLVNATLGVRSGGTAGDSPSNAPSDGSGSGEGAPDAKRSKAEGEGEQAAGVHGEQQGAAEGGGDVEMQEQPAAGGEQQQQQQREQEQMPAVAVAAAAAAEEQQQQQQQQTATEPGGGEAAS